MYRKRTNEIYGVTGRKGHGKDTFSKLVLGVNTSRRRGVSSGSFSITHFADLLKHMSIRVFGLTEAQLYDPNQKEAPLCASLDLDLFLPAMRAETGLDLQPRGKRASTPREVLQFFGTEYVRSIQDDYWIQRTLGEVHGRVLIADTRFRNEAAALKSVGGKIIKILRVDLPEDNSTHASEMEVDLIEPDLLLGVRTGDLSLIQRVATLIAIGKFEAATKYDYRSALDAIAAYTAGGSLESSARVLHQEHKDPYALRNLLAYYGIPIRRQAKNRNSHTVVAGVAHKQCGHCSQSKSLSEFNASSKAWDGLASLCRNCASKDNKSRYTRYGKVDSLVRTFELFKRSAQPRGWEFTISLEDIQTLWDAQEGLCWYSGRPLKSTVHDPDKVSLDRIDSTKGYIQGNVVLCTKRVNMMKREMTVAEFKQMVSELHTTFTRLTP